MVRYKPEKVNGTLFLVAENDQIKIGTINNVVDAIGGEIYTIEYDQEQRTQPWLQTDDGMLEVDVREVITTLNYTEEFASELRNYDMETDRYGLPTRTVEFANGFIDILEQQGSS